MSFSYFLHRIFIFCLLICISSIIHAQNIYELGKLSEDDWLSMSTEDRLNSLGKANKYAQNQTFLGDFGKHYDQYKRWGYEFYEMEDRYQNYAFRGFENYNIIESKRRRWSYNEFGDRIAKMTSSGRIWQERYYDDGRSTISFPSGYINAISTGNIDGVWVAKETTDDWAFSAIGAGSIRTKFTPLTLSLPNLNGMRLDFQSANYSLAMVNTAYMNTYRYGGVLLRGGHFRRKLGALTLGATYVNQYGVHGSREGGDSWYGTVGYYTPTPLIVALRFLDDSPEDGDGGPVIHNVKLKVNGRYRGDIIPRIIVDDVSRERTSTIINPLYQKYLTPDSPVGIGGPSHDQLEMWGTLPKYMDYLYNEEYMSGMDMKNVEKNFGITLSQKYYSFLDPGINHANANGTESIVYYFDISTIKEHVNRVEAEIEVANDYRIQTALIYTKKTEGGHDTTGKVSTHYNATYWKTMAQAEGNIKDQSNLTKLTVNFGLQVASVMYGVDMDFNYRGLKIKGEYVANSSHYMFPDDFPGTGIPPSVVEGLPPRTGHKWEHVDNAYYMTVEKEWKKFGFAGEIFKMGKFFRPYLDYFYGVSGGSYTNLNSRNFTARVPLIEDNDDDDQYPDTMLVQRSMGFNIRSSEDPDGVFPGNDADNDGVADNNKNNNSIPDYDEPFLMFDADPDKFVFGNDFNNNSIPDFREDDMKWDTPYDLDRQGKHFMLRYTPVSSVSLVAGSFRTHGVGTHYRTNDDYIKLIVNYNVFAIGNIYAEYRYERIQDDIRDQYIQVSSRMKEEYLEQGITASVGRFTRELYYDELEYKNSKVSRLFLDSKIRAIPTLTLENHVKFENNDQLEGLMYDNTYQPGELLKTLAMVNKLVYTKSFGRWIISPGIKYRFYKKVRSDIPRPGDYYTLRIPLLICKYVISDRSNIMLGLQGLSGIEFDFKDKVQSENDFKQHSYILQFQNSSVYFGYNIWASTGIKYDEKQYAETKRSFENYSSSSLFVKVFLGW